MAITTADVEGEVTSTLHNEIPNLINGTNGTGANNPVKFVRLNSTTVYALHVNAVDTTNGLIQKWTYGDPDGTPTTVATLTKSGFSVPVQDKGGERFNVLAYGAVGGGSTDDTAAFQAAINAASARNGGLVYVPTDPSGIGYRLNSRITIPSNVILAGPSMHKPSASAGARLVIGHATWPAILIGGSATTASHCGLRDIALIPNAAASSTATYEGDSSYGAMIGIDRADRVYLHRVWVNDSQDAIAVGTSNNPLGASKVEIRDCETYFRRYGFACRGSAYIDIQGGHWQDTSPGTGTAIRFFGAGDANGLIVDGGRIVNLFVESVGTGIKCEQTAGAVNNLWVDNLQLDGVRVAGFYADPSGGSVSKVFVNGGIFNCYDGASGGTGYGVIIDQSSTGYVRNCSFKGLLITDAGRHGVWLVGPTASDRISDIDFLACVIQNVSTETDDTYSGFRMENSSQDIRIMGCVITSHLPGNNTNRIKYGISTGSSLARVAFAGNRVDGEQTAKYDVGTAHDGDSVVWDNPDQPPGYGSATGSTSGPTTTSTSYADLAEMSVTISTIGGDIEARFDAQIKNSDLAANTFVAFSLDAAAEVHERAWNQEVADQYGVVSIAHRFASVSAGSHTVKVRWKVSAGTATANGVRRDLIVREQR